jgi:hypothetical protein
MPGHRALRKHWMDAGEGDIGMSLAQRFERRLESLVGGAFARVFKGQVEPVEIGSARLRTSAM